MVPDFLFWYGHLAEGKKIKIKQVRMKCPNIKREEQRKINLICKYFHSYAKIELTATVMLN